MRKAGSIHIHLPYKEGSKRCTMFLLGAKRLLPTFYLIFSLSYLFFDFYYFGFYSSFFYFSSALLLRTT